MQWTVIDQPYLLVVSCCCSWSSASLVLQPGKVEGPAMSNLHQSRQDLYAKVMTWSVAISLMGFFVWLLGDLLWHGFSGISWEFVTSHPFNAGREGGIAPILVSTGLILSVCMFTALPIGLATAVLLAEFIDDRSWIGMVIRRSLDVLAGVPSIVFGLFGNAFFCVALGLGFSILSGGLTLA